MAINQNLVNQVKGIRSEHAAVVAKVNHFVGEANTLARQHDAIYGSLSDEEKAAVDGKKPTPKLPEVPAPAPAVPKGTT